MSAFGPYTYQKELLEKAKYRNSINQGLMSWLMHHGVEVVGTGTVEGPYTKITTYFLSDGSTWDQVSASRLSLIGIAPIRVK